MTYAPDYAPEEYDDEPPFEMIDGAEKDFFSLRLFTDPIVMMETISSPPRRRTVISALTISMTGCLPFFIFRISPPLTSGRK